MDVMPNGNTRLSTWVSFEAKQRFSTAAARQELSDSALLRRLVEQMLATASVDASAGPPPVPETRAARVTVRLLQEDQTLLRERATARGMPTATYMSSLVRAHLRNLSPLPHSELNELRRAIAQLNAVGRHLNQIARVLNQDARAAVPGRQEVQVMLRVAEGLRDHFRALLKANFESWRAGHAEKAH